MADIKLSRLPDRTPVKLTISVSPELVSALNRYAEFYCAVYGQEETVVELVPAIVGAFLESDKAFARWRRNATDRAEQPL